MTELTVFSYPDLGERSRFKVAIDLARGLKAHLTCVDLHGADAPAAGGRRGLDVQTHPGGISGRELVERASVPCRWISGHGTPAHLDAASFGNADIVVLSTAPEFELLGTRTVIGRALVEAHKIVVAVPTTVEGVDLSGDALILWDGSDGAAAAMRGALALLRLAATVTIMEIDDGSLTTRAGEAATYLAAREIAGRVRTEPSRGKATGTVILEQIERLAPAYVVMGGFGHSRLRENLFGGVTERLLSLSPVPVVMRH